ncbi:polyhydroxyalkanoate synthesis repressor PhaR [bacterium]|nr:polyhydroxyalkanoate synthesis repressor PhaR [bacterium]
MTHVNGSGETIIIKKYANRRLYDTSTSAYVTLEHLSTLVQQGKDFIVQDAKTGADLTRPVLTQIIFEQENRKDGVLPVSFLRQLIQFYGESVQSMLPAYLELSMRSFSEQQEKWRQYMHTAFPDSEKAKTFDDQVRKNMEMFEDTVRFFSPFAASRGRGEEEAAPEKEPAPTREDALRALQEQMAEMQKQLALLARNPPKPDA